MTDRKYENTERIDKALEGLAREDAPDRLVQDTLARVRDAQAADHVPNRVRDRSWARGLAAAVVAFAAVGIVYNEIPAFDDAPKFQRVPPEPEVKSLEDGEVSTLDYFRIGGKDRPESQDERPAPEKAQSSATGDGVASGSTPQLAGNERLLADGDLIVNGERVSREVEADEGRELGWIGGTAGASGRADTEPAASPPPSVLDRRGRLETKQKAAKPESSDRNRDGTSQLQPKRRATRSPIEELSKNAPGTPISDVVVSGSFGKEAEDLSAAIDDQTPDFQREMARDRARFSSPGPADKLGSSVRRHAGTDDDRKKLDLNGSLSPELSPELAPDGRRAERFLAQYRNLDGLHYQQPTGYWANSYVPGDPAMRRLEAQLRAQYPQALTTTLTRNTQPFDAPENAALSVYLHATQSAVDGPSRVQLQVGLKAAQRQGGHRPPMNVAVVLDLPETVELAVAQQARALLMAMNEQRQTGDRFLVTVAGVPGGAVIGAHDYRHGTVVAFIEALANGELEGDTFDLVDAVVAAVDRLAADDDPNAVLGSSLVLLVTADGIEAQTSETVEILAHRSAVAGMPVSLVTLPGASGSDLDAIALAGQGRLRALGAPADAAQLVDRELHSASRTVARAVRLRIQLAPGVHLVEVIGSVRLDELHAERVREAERSIDQRLSRNWGIETDRGEDEDGIQIVIPGMAAGENHVVLLDVVVDGPGTVADVRVRYKDLVAMSNGVARASLSLADADATRQVRGPLERNVLKNLVAFETAEAARRSGRHLANRETAAARTELTNALTLIAGLRQRVAGWENDAELQADEQRLARFVNELDAGRTDVLVAALEYAAYRKLLPATMNED